MYPKIQIDKTNLRIGLNYDELGLWFDNLL